MIYDTDLAATPLAGGGQVVREQVLPVGGEPGDPQIAGHDSGLVLAPASNEQSQNPAVAYLEKLSPGSRPAMRGSLQIVADLLTAGACTWETMPWPSIEPQHGHALRSELAARYAPTTANKVLAAMRGVLKVCWELGLMSSESYQRAASIPSVRGQTPPRGRAIEAAELKALFAVCRADRTPAGARDGALLAVLYGSGLRRAEAVALDLADYDARTGSIIVRAGRGRKARICYTASGQETFIEAWVNVRGNTSGPLFCPVYRGGHIRIRRLDSRTVLDVVQRRGQAAGVKDITPHDFRRSMIVDLLDAGADIVTVQELAGHANTETTARYDRRGEAAKKKAAGLLHVPLSEE